MSVTTKITDLRNWKFTIDQTQYGMNAGWARADYDDSGWSDVQSNTSWETYDYAMADYEGHGWYRTRYAGIRKAGRRHILKFNGVGGVAKVFVNGKLVCTNEDRYLPFEADISSYLWDSRESVIAVLVDNSFRGESHLPGGFTTEWVLYGGLNHKVWVEEQSAVYVTHVRLDAAADGTFRAVLTCKNRDNREKLPAFQGQLALKVEGLEALTFSKELTLAYQETQKIVFEGKAENAKTWSPDSPNLYNVTVTLTKDGQEVCTIRERTGFRTIEVSGTDFLLNGEKIYLKGANRYDEYGSYGINPPEELLRADLLKMKECGLNLVRTHYPQDEMHYRIADEVGIMYMIEVPLNWWYPVKQDTFADFCGLAAEAIDNTDRTFMAHCNHPSWTIWSTGNECGHSHPACQQMFRMVAERMRRYEPKRLITYASNKPLLNSQELDFCDFLAMNKYTGILSEHESEFPRKMIAPLKEKLQTAKELYPNVPHVMTEFGYVCVAGVHGNPHEGRYTEDFGANFMAHKLETFMTDELMRGMVIWSWADYRHRHGFYGDGMHLKATFGPYGLVTIDRKEKPKLYALLKDFYTNWNP